MKKVKYNNEYIIVDDSPLDDNETGKLSNIKKHDYNSNYCEKKETISNSDVLEKTLIDLWGDKNE